MNLKPSLFFMMLLLLSLMLYQSWQTDFNPNKPAETSTVKTTEDNFDVADTNTATNSVSDAPVVKGELVTVETDVLRLTINTVGGDIVKAELLQYDESLKSKKPYLLLNSNEKQQNIVQSGLVGPNGIDVNNTRAVYSITTTNYKLTDGMDKIEVPLTYTKNGIEYKKIFTFTRNSYAININFEINNTTNEPIYLSAVARLKETTPEKKSSGFFSSFGMQSYEGAMYSSSDTRYTKYSYSDMENKPLNIHSNTGWVGIAQHNFLTAWIPTGNYEFNIFSKEYNNGKNIAVGITSDQIKINPKSQTILTNKLWIGPKLTNELEATAEYLDLTVDYGWAWFISKPLSKLLKFVFSFVHNWGIAIIIVTLIVKACLYPLTHAQYASMAKMRVLQPKIQAIKERYADDKQRVSQETMKLYKEEKVNPLGGCLPLIIQMPIFLGLYYMFMETVEFRHAPFFGWIQDLSAQDPYYILPILMAGSMFLLQKMSPSVAGDPTQQKIMMFMPLMFTFFFLFFPAGLVLYWLVSNLITILQQQIIYRNLEKKGLHTRKKK